MTIVNTIVNTVRTVPLPADPRDVPSLSLHVLAKNAESVLGRLLDNVGAYVQELRFVLNDTTDASEKVLRRWVETRRSRGLETTTPLHVDHVTSVTHPHFYVLDVAATYEVGSPLDGEHFEGPFTGRPLLADWAAARNVGWGSDAAWRLFLDADDLVADPGKLPGLLKVLEEMRVDLAATKYVFGRGESGVPNAVSYRERLARNVAGVTWEGRTHEVLVGGLRRVLVEDCLSVTDMKDNWGYGVRVPGRCFKVLYHQARLAKWDVSPRHLAYLVQESRDMVPPSWVVASLLPAYEAKSVMAEELAWVLSTAGELLEAREDYAGACELYERATRAYPSSKAAFRLCRARFMSGDFGGCLAAYELGVSYLAEPQVLDDGPGYADSSKILVAQAYFELGRGDEARALVEEVSRLFPRSAPVAALRDSVVGKK